MSFKWFVLLQYDVYILQSHSMFPKYSNAYWANPFIRIYLCHGRFIDRSKASFTLRHAASIRGVMDAT